MVYVLLLILVSLNYRALKSEFWGDIWLSDLVEICALVNLGLACLLFLYAALLEYIDIRCLSKSHAELKKLFKGRSSSNRRGLHWSHQGYLNSDELLVKYLHPIALRRYVFSQYIYHLENF